MEIYKVKTISCAHQLALPYESKCNRLHGHNYTIEVWIKGERNKQGMVADYSDIAEVINKFDHQNLNDFMQQPTAENFCYLLIDRFVAQFKGKCALKTIKVRVGETCTSYAEVESNVPV